MTLVVTGLAANGMAQYSNQSAIRDVVRRIQTRTDSLQRAVQNAADRNNYRVDDINRLISDFEAAVNQLDRRLSSRRTNRSRCADRSWIARRRSTISSLNNRLGAGSRREWQAIRADLDQLAGYYNLSPRWGSGSSSSSGGNNDYNLNDFQMRQLIERLNVAFSDVQPQLRKDLNRERAIAIRSMKFAGS